MQKTVAIVGASGAIANSILEQVVKRNLSEEIYAFSQSPIKEKLSGVKYYSINYADENSVEEASKIASSNNPIDFTFVANGLLHTDEIKPEKSWRDLSFTNFEKIFHTNVFVPAIVAKYFLPKMNIKQRSIFSVLSARVGSISDNQLGGWYSYRSSKSALNMVVKNLAIEVGRKSKSSIVVGLHPGTVDSPLSYPFQKNVASEKLFSPEYAAMNLMRVIDNLSPDHSGKVFAWDGVEIEP